MATFEAKKLELTQVNGGQEYEQGDFLQSDTINDVVEGTAYAQNVAEEANAKSDKAVSTANSANGTANAASEKVDDFDERITKAQGTANDAVSNAATAQDTADSATTEINKIKNGTTTVPNAQHAVSADSADMATKAQQDVNGNPINTTYATVEYVDDLVTEKQGTRVNVNNVNVAELSFTSDPQAQITQNANAIADIENGTTTVPKASQDGDGNNIADTYAKLSQVVRVDAAQSLTDTEKQQALENVGQNTSNTTTLARAFATYSFYTNYSAYVKLGTFYVGDSNIEIDINAGLGAANTSGKIILLFLNGDIQLAEGRWDQKSNDITFWYNIRDKEGNYCYVDVYCNNVPYGKIYCTVRAAGAQLISRANNVSSLPSTKVLINDSFRFVTDPSKLEPSTANGWTQTTTSGSLPGAGIYMITFNHLPEQSQPSYYYPAILIYDGTLGTCTVTDDTGALLVSMVVKPSGIRLVNPVNIANQVQSTNIYYKRIA